MMAQPSTLRLSSQRAAELAGVGRSTINGAIRAGKLAATQMRDGQVLVDRASLEAWIERRFYEEGGTDDPNMISLREEAVGRCSPPSDLTSWA